MKPDRPTNKALRLLWLWRCFADGAVHTTATLARRLRVHPKTIQRDLELLRDAGCDFETNRNGMATPGVRLVRLLCPCCQHPRPWRNTPSRPHHHQHQTTNTKPPTP